MSYLSQQKKLSKVRQRTNRLSAIAYDCTDTGYGYIDTVIRQFQKIRIHQYVKYIYNFINKYYEDNTQS
jgi:hypothetical protein